MDTPEEPAEPPPPAPSPPPVSGSSTSTTAAITRTYDCTFCKMGFSNAQALGGHMNIHSKKRAKVKPPPADHSCLRTASAPLYVPNHPTTTFQWPKNMESHHGSTSPEIMTNPSVGTPHQLRLFGEAHVAREDRRSDEGSVGGTTESVEVGLDLELRLGPEPPDSASSSRDI